MRGSDEVITVCIVVMASSRGEGRRWRRRHLCVTDLVRKMHIFQAIQIECQVFQHGLGRKILFCPACFIGARHTLNLLATQSFRDMSRQGLFIKRIVKGTQLTVFKIQ